MKKQIFLITALAALMTVSCTKSGMEATGANPDGQIKVKTTIAKTTATKGLAAATTALDKLAFVHAQLATAPAAGTPVDFSGKTPFGGTRAAGEQSEVVFAPADRLLYQYDKTDGKISYLMGYSPAQTPVNNSVSWTVTGETDILVSDLWNAGTYATPEATTPMTFKHVLARVEVILQSKTAGDLPTTKDTWGKITGVSFKKAFPRMAFDYATNKVAPSGQEADKIDLPLLNGNTYTSGAFVPVDIAPTGSTTVMASAMVPPTGEASFTLVVSSEKMPEVEVPVTLTAPQATFIAGYGYTVTLNCGVADKYITVASSAVTPWDETGTGSGNAELPPQGPVIIEFGKAPYSKITDEWNMTYTSQTKSYNDWYGTVAGGHNGVYTNTNGQGILDLEPVYFKFEIAKEDLSRNNDGVDFKFTWTEAQGTTPGGNLCAQKLGAGWRLPRASELKIIMVHSTELNSSGNGFMPLINNNSYHWSATEDALGSAIWVDVGTYSRGGNVTELHKIRCIREIPVVPSAQPVILEYGVAPYGVQLRDYNNAVIGATTTSRNHWWGAGVTNGGYPGTDDALTWIAEKPYYKFEVAKRDLWWWDATGMRYVFTWDEAQGTTSDGNLCVKTFGQGWRLPRVSELAVMMHNMDALNAAGNGFMPFREDFDNDGYDYWSATEYSATSAWKVNTDNEPWGDSNKTVKRVVRCIREIPVTSPFGYKTAADAVIGDFSFSDGTFGDGRTATLSAAQKAACIGIVYWTGDPTTNDAALKRDYPGCTHGMIVSLTDVQSPWQSAYATYNNTVNAWTTANATGFTQPIISADALTDPINKIMGYNNTGAIMAFNAASANSGWKVNAVEAVKNYRTSTPVPAASSPWFLPSVKELTMLCGLDNQNGNVINDGFGTGNCDAMNVQLAKIAGATQIPKGMHYTSTEGGPSTSWIVDFSTGGYVMNDVDDKAYVKSEMLSTRFVRAF